MFQFLKKILRGGIAFRFQVLRIMPPESLGWASLSIYANQGLVEESLFSCRREAKDSSPVQLVLADNQEIKPLRSLYRIIVGEGMSYPHDWFPDQDNVMDYSPSPNTS